MSVFIDLYRKTRALAIVNQELQREVSARQKAQEALEQVNQELELRVAERTAALTVAHRGVKENEERLRMAMDVAEIAAWEWDVSRRPDDVVDRPGDALRVPAGMRLARSGACSAPCIQTTSERLSGMRSRPR